MSLIYCIEDDDGIRELVSCALKAGGYEVRGFSKSKTFYDALKSKGAVAYTFRYNASG